MNILTGVLVFTLYWVTVNIPDCVLEPNYYDLLSLNRTTEPFSVPEIKKAFRKASLQVHPDKVDETYLPQFLRLSAVHDVLVDDQKREDYLKWGERDCEGDQCVLSIMVEECLFWFSIASLIFFVGRFARLRSQWRFSWLLLLVLAVFECVMRFSNEPPYFLQYTPHQKVVLSRWFALFSFLLPYWGVKFFVFPDSAVPSLAHVDTRLTQLCDRVCSLEAAMRKSAEAQSALLAGLEERLARLEQRG